MREEDETRQEEEPDVPVEVENEEVTGDGVIEAYMTATCPGQTHQEAIDTVQMIFEVDVQTLRNLLRTHIRRNCGKQNESVEVAIRILKKVTNKDHKDEKDEHLKRDADPERSKPVEKKGQAAHERLFPSCYEGPRDDGSLIRPAEATSKLNPLISNDGVVGQLFGLGNRIDEASTRAGAGGDDDEAQMGARVVHALEGLRKATEGDKRGSPGTRSSIGAEESLDVYLARGCNTLTVEVCPDVTGKELFDALKRACSRAKAKLQQIEWPCLVTNGIAYGLAAMQHGGKDHTTLAPWQLSVAHAVTAKPKDFDQYEAPKDDKIEPKPRYPTHFATWLKQAKNEIRMLGSVLGLEHKKERLKALDQIEKAHEQDSDVWPEPLGRAQSSVDGGASRASRSAGMGQRIWAAAVERNNHAHQPSTTTKGLRWTVLAQLIRRGGLKSGPLIQPGQVDGRIAQLRAQAKAERDEKVKDGSGQKQGCLPPEEYEGVQYTQLEDELRELTRGPHTDWLRDPMLEPGREPHTIWERRVEHPEAQRRLKALEELEKGGAFTKLANRSSYLQSHVRGRMLNSMIEKQEMTIDEVLLEATEKGCPELAQEAEKVLNEERSVGWADDERQAWISAPVWCKEKGYGEGKFEFQCGDRRVCWRYLDYKDKLPVPNELASALGLQPGEEEERQCLVLHPAAGVLLWEGDWDPERRPTIDEVKQKAQLFRAELWDEAANAIAELGDPAPWIGAREEVRGGLCWFRYMDKGDGRGWTWSE
eukprot:g14952.t1